MKRIVVLLTVVALMVVMLAMGVASAFAAPSSPCPGNSGSIIQSSSPFYDPAYDRNNNGRICKYDRYDHNGFYVTSRYKDDRQFL